MDRVPVSTRWSRRAKTGSEADKDQPPPRRAVLPVRVVVIHSFDSAVATKGDQEGGRRRAVGRGKGRNRSSSRLGLTKASGEGDT